MFPASLTMLPLAPLPVVHATIVNVDARVVLGALVLAMIVTGGLLAQRALASASTRRSSRLRTLARHAH
jgi:hypothetical protein